MNIYITRDNEERLRNLTEQSMSGLINFLLIEYFSTHEVKDRTVANTKDEYVGLVFAGGAVNEGKKWCKHGFGPTTCKFAKPGKPCK